MASQISGSAKKTINVVVPMVAIAITLLVALRYTKNWKMLLLFCGLAGIIFWVITARITKTLAENKPAPTDPNGTSPFIDNYDPTALTDSINSLYSCWFCLRNDDPFNQLLALPSAPFRLVVNDWNNRYYTKHNKTLLGVVNDYYGSGLGAFTHSELKDNLVTKFNDEGLPNG
jgi:hypothetical protein